MSSNPTILLTGAAGFIGSCLTQFLNQNGYKDLILVDDFSSPAKLRNWSDKIYAKNVERSHLFQFLEQNVTTIDIVIHLGARTDTTEFDYSIHEKLNVEYSKKLWGYCCKNNIPFIYASSAATYGGGEYGYEDNHEIVNSLRPLNPYGISKNEFDKWALVQTRYPPFWTGLKFFNVYGPNEIHKGRMASVVWHSFGQIVQNDYVKLFRSHRDDFNDGEQLRDFIYVMDLLKVIKWMGEEMLNKRWAGKDNGLYNLGTGKARSFKDLVNATFLSMKRDPKILYIDMPEDIRDKYQYFTEANMNKLRRAGYKEEFFALEDGVNDYVSNFLSQNKVY